MRREALVAALNGGNVVAAFATQLVIYRTFGTSQDADVYFATAVIPQLILMVLSTTASGALVPLLAQLDRPQQDRDTWNLLAVTTGATGVAAFALSCLAQPMASLMWPGFRDTQSDLALRLLQVQLASGPLIAATVVLTAVQHARHHFAGTELLGLVLTAAVTGGLVLTLPRYGVESAVWLSIGRYALQAVILGALVRPSWPHWDSSTLATAWRRSRVLLAGNAFFKADTVVDRHLLSTGPVGSLSLYNMAHVILGALAGMIGQAWGNAAVPKLAAHYGARNRPGFLGLYKHNKRMILATSSVVALACCALAQPVLTALTGRHLQAAGGEALRDLLIALAGVPVFGALGSLLAGSFYAMGDTKTPTYLSVATFSVFVMAKVWVFHSMGLVAFCALTSVYYGANAFIVSRSLRHSISRTFPS